MTKRQSDLDVLAHNIKIWRSEKKTKSSRLPAVLVKEVVRLCQVHGAKSVCAEVGLSNYGRWQERADAQKNMAGPTKKIVPVASDANLTRLAAEVLSAKHVVSGAIGGSSIEVRSKDLVITFHNYSPSTLFSALREVGLC